MKNCANCGVILRDGETVCHVCGQVVTMSSDMAQEPITTISSDYSVAAPAVKMNESKNARIYSLIAAICCSLYAIYIIYNSIINIILGYGTIGWTSIAGWIFYIGLPVLLFIKKKNIGFVIITGIYLIADIYFLIRHFSVINLGDVILDISLLALFLINIIPALKKYMAATKILGFVPAGIYLIVSAFCNRYYIFWRYWYHYWRPILAIASLSAGFLFIGMWLRESVIVVKEKKNNNPYSTFNPTITESKQNSPIGGVDELRAYKELLDCGAITQEEFDLKKKQILDL